MRRLAGADETVEGNVQPLIHLLEAPRVAGGEVDRRQAFGLRGLNHLQAMLVGAGQEEHVLAVEPREARNRIGRDRLIGVADMRLAVRVRDRRGDGVFWRRFCGGALATFFAAFLDFFFFEDFLATTKSFWSAQT
jgi:hypothetical protein